MIALLSNAILQIATAWANPAGTDMLSAVGAANQARAGSCLYCPDVELASQGALVQYPANTPPQYYLYAPVFAWLFRPVGLLPFATAAVVVSVFQIMCLGIATILLTMRSRSWTAAAAIVATAISIPANWDLRLIQWDGTLLLAAVIGLRCLDRGHDLRAGLAMGVMLLKPQLVWLLPIFLLWRPRVLLGAGIGAAAWVGASIVTEGGASVVMYAHAVVDQHPAVATTAGIVTLVSEHVGSLPGFIVAVVGAVAATAASIRFRGRLQSDPAQALAVGLVVSLLASPHLNLYDLVLLTVPVAVLARDQPWAALVIAVAISVAEFAEDLFSTGPGGLAPPIHLSSWIAVVLIPILIQPALWTRICDMRGRAPRGRPPHIAA